MSSSRRRVIAGGATAALGVIAGGRRASALAPSSLADARSGAKGCYDARLGLFNAHGLNMLHWRYSVARAHTFAQWGTSNAARVVCYGDSTTAGFIDPPGGGTTYQPDAAWPTVLRQKLAREFGEAGTGLLYFDNADPHPLLHFTGSWEAQPYGPYGASCRRGETGAVVEVTAPATAFRVMHLNSNLLGGGGTISVEIDGVPTAQINTNSPWEIKLTEVPCPSADSHTVRLRAAPGPIHVIAVEASYGSNGVQVTNAARGSTIAASLINGHAAADTSLVSAIDVPSPALGVVAFGTNSYGNQTPSAAANDTRVIAERLLSRGASVLLCTSIHWNAPPRPEGPQHLWDEALYQLAVDLDVPLFDVMQRWGGSPAFGGGYYSGPVHPNHMGYVDYASAVLAIILS